MGSRIWSLVRKEFIQIVRDRRTLAMLILIPVIWLVAFGYAVTFDVKHVSTAIVDQAHTATSQSLVSALTRSDSISLGDADARSEADVRSAIADGTVSAGVIIPAQYGQPGPRSQVRVLVDGSDLFGSQSMLRATQTILEQQAAKTLQQRAGLIGGVSLDSVMPAVDILYNPQLKSAYVMIPALVGLVMAFIATIMTALGVVRERERGTLEQLIVTPVRPLELMVGKILPYMLIAVLDFVLVVVIGLTLFDVPMRGSWLLLGTASLLFLLGSLGIGLLVSTVSQNQQQAMQLAFFTLFPQIIFSGFIFPLAAIPWGVRWIGYLAPLTYLVPVTRGVFLKAQGWGTLWPYVLVLMFYGIGVLVLAATRFQKRLA